MSTTQESNLGAVVIILVGSIILVPVLFAVAGLPGYGLLGGGVWEGALFMAGTTPGWLPLSLGGLLLLGVGVLLIGLYLLVRGRRARTVATDPALEELRHNAARTERATEEYTARRDRIDRDR